MLVNDSSELAVFWGTRDGSCDLSGFKWSSYLMLLYLCQTYGFIQLPCLAGLPVCPGANTRGAAAVTESNCHFLRGEKKKLLSLSAFKVRFGSREVQVSRASGRRGV